MAWIDDLHDFFGASQLERVSFGKTGIFFFSEHRNQVCIAVLTFHSSFFARFMCRFMTRVVEPDSTLFLSLATLWSVSYFVETTAEVKRNLSCAGDSGKKYVELLIKNRLSEMNSTAKRQRYLETRAILILGIFSSWTFRFNFRRTCGCTNLCKKIEFETLNCSLCTGHFQSVLITKTFSLSYFKT